MSGFRLNISSIRFHSFPAALALAALGSLGPAAASEFRLVPGESRVEFKIGHLLLGTVEGRFEEVTGNFQLNDSGNALLTLKSKVAVKSVNTGIGFRDEQLRGESFLGADQFPEISFSAKKCDSTASGTLVMGILTVARSSNPVSFLAGIPKIHVEAGGKRQAVVTGRLVLKRKEVGLVFTDSRDKDEKWLGDEVQVGVTLIGREP